MAELLLELLSEEIPARMQARAADDLRRLAGDELKAAGLAFDRIETYVTPRRLVLVVDGIPETGQQTTHSERGPRVDAPQQAIEGFLKKVARPNVDHPDICIREKEKGKFYFFEVAIPPKNAASELPRVLSEILDAMSWPKSMRWLPGQTQFWVRPLRGILAIFNGKKLEFDYDLVHSREAVSSPSENTTIFARDFTFGHRFGDGEPIKPANFADYRAKLKKAEVILDAAERRAIIERDATALAQAHGLTFAMDEGLLNEVAGLVEWPVVRMGSIDKAFMDLPPEVLTVSMRQHQKYFRLDDADGNIAPRFIVVANMETTDGGKTVVAGNERVLRARLSDAQFFWDQDRKRKLESRVAALKDRVFHAKLGTDFERVDRIRKLAMDLAQYIPGADKASVARAASLCKADLTTGMVGEFPELQGTMGNYYAIQDGEPIEVAMAIADHYSPVGPTDSCPTAPVSVAVALADKIDTLTGFFAIDEKPTGSKDPFALRRAALGVIRLILESNIRINLTQILVASYCAFPSSVAPESRQHLTVGSLLDFFADRLKVALRDKGVRHDLVDAVFSERQATAETLNNIDLVRVLMRVDALEAFLRSDDGANLLVAYRRAANIVRIESKKDDFVYTGMLPDEGLLTEAAEIQLNEALAFVEAAMKPHIANDNFVGAMAELAKLRASVDEFFEKVLVNCEDSAIRKNRLELLARIPFVMNSVANFSRIEDAPKE